MSDKKIKPEVTEKIVPVITPAVQSATPASFEPKSGEYHMVRLDLNGKEIPGSDFSIGANSFRRTYEKLTTGDKPTYSVKKKPN